MKRLFILILSCSFYSSATFGQPFEPYRLVGTWSGEWTNTTFGSNGSLDMTIMVDTDADTMSATIDWGGFVFGGSDPDPYMVSGPYDDSGISFEYMSPLEGNATLVIDSLYNMTVTAPEVPSPGVTGVEIEASFADDTTISGTAVIHLAGGMDANGIATLYGELEGKPNTTAVESDEVPQYLELRENYPNPVSAMTTIEFVIPAPGNVRVDIVDLHGRRVAVALDEPRSAGLNRLEFDARDLSNGVYLYRISSGGYGAVREMIVQR